MLCEEQKRNDVPWAPDQTAITKAIRFAAANRPRHGDHITIAATPAKLDPKFEAILDGGIKHEIAHSRFSAKGKVNRTRLEAVIRMWQSDIPYYVGFCDYVNVVEDVMVERKEVASHAGGRLQLLRLSEYIVEQESEVSNRDQWSLVTCCFRDIMLNANYHPDQLDVVEAYGQEIVDFVLNRVQEEVDRSRTMQNSYEVLEVAFAAYNKLCGPLPARKPTEANGETEQSTDDGKTSPETDRKNPDPDQQSNDDKTSPRSECGAGEPDGDPGNADTDTNSSPPEVGSDDDEADSDHQTNGNQTKSGSAGAQPPPEAGQNSSRQGVKVPTSRPKLLTNRTALEPRLNAATARSVVQGKGHVPISLRLDRVEKVQDEDFRLFCSARQKVVAATGSQWSRLVQAMHGSSRSRTVRGTHTGKIDSQRVYKLLTHERAKVCKTRVEKRSLNTAVVIGVDESSSLRDDLDGVRQCLITLAEPCSMASIPTFIFGFGNHIDGAAKLIEELEPNLSLAELAQRYTRLLPVRYRVFKEFNEPYQKVRARLASTQAEMLTPLVDGVEFALRTASRRKESRRIVFMLTDGHPEYFRACQIRHAKFYPKVISRMCSEAERVGIEVIGIGVGAYAKYVKDVFADHVWVSSFEELPRPLISKLASRLNQA